MILNPFKIFSKSFVGVDIGTDSVKLVELTKEKSKTLTNYGVLSSRHFSSEDVPQKERGTLYIDEDVAVRVLKSIIKEAGVTAKDAFFAIPDFVSFFTTFDLPSMTEQEIPEAIKYEAPRRIPLPLSEVTLDWQIIKSGTPQQGLRVLLVTVPNEAINQYQRIAAAAGLKLKAMEAEVFAMSRALIKYQDRNNVVCLIDIGKRSTTINIVSQGILKISYSFDVSSNSFTNNLTSALHTDNEKAEIIKRMYGIGGKKPVIQELLQPLAETVVEKTKSIFNELYMEDKERVGKVILAGGGVEMPGLVDFFNQELDLPVEIANPFIDITYPPALQDVLQKLGPKFIISVGMALRGMEKT